MKKIEMTEFLNGVATFNADPYCVEDEVMAQELFDETQGELEEITNVDDFEDAVLKLDLEGRSPKRIYRCGTAPYACQTFSIKQQEDDEESSL